MRSVEGEQSNLVFVVQHQTAQDEILVGIGSSSRNCRPSWRVRELQFGNAELARILWIKIDVEMLQNKILLLGPRPDEKIDVRETKSFRKNRKERDPLVRPGHFWLQRGFGRV